MYRKLTRWFVTLSVAAFSPFALAHGDLHERIAAVTSQLLTNTVKSDLWLLRADLRRQHGEFDAALADLEMAGQLKLDWPLVALQRARIFFDMAQFSRCERAATDCLERDATNADALVLRARSRARLKEFGRAIADYNAVLANPDGPRPLPDVYLERARAQAALEQFDNAIRGLDDGMKRLGETPSFALPAIEYERQRGAFDAALGRVEKARKFFNNESFLALRGEILLQAGKPAAAEIDFQTALAALKKLPPARRALPQTQELEARLRAGLRQATLSPTTNTITTNEK